MNRITVFVLGVLVGALGLYVTENFYIVRSEQSFHLVPKVASKLELPYRDIRNYSAEDWRNNPSLAIALMKAQKQDLLIDSGLDEVRNQLDGLLRTLGGG